MGGEDEMETDASYGTQVFVKCISLYYLPAIPNYDYFVYSQYIVFQRFLKLQSQFQRFLKLPQIFPQLSDANYSQQNLRYCKFQHNTV